MAKFLHFSSIIDGGKVPFGRSGKPIATRIKFRAVIAVQINDSKAMHTTRLKLCVIIHLLLLILNLQSKWWDQVYIVFHKKTNLAVFLITLLSLTQFQSNFKCRWQNSIEGVMWYNFYIFQNQTLNIRIQVWIIYLPLNTASNKASCTLNTNLGKPFLI